MKETILFRVDGGKVWGISFGHIYRSLILASVLARKNKIIYIMKNYQDGVFFVKQQGYEVETIGVDDDSDNSLINFLEKYSPKQVVFDLRSIKYNMFFDYTRERHVQTVVFDILGNCTGVPDILINDSFVKEFTKYPHLTNRTKLCLGPKFFFTESLPEIIPIRDNVKEVMITMGGSDPAGLTLKILSSLTECLTAYNVHVVMGPAFTDEEQVSNLTVNFKNIKIYKNPDNFIELLSQQDVVITAAGRTLYECAGLGRPLIVVPTIEFEALRSIEYERLTGSFDIGLWDVSSPEKIMNAMRIYTENKNLRRSIFKTSRRLVDSHGLERILNLLN
ncbi:spore coat polysaccharide biosynthesis protein, predicted glycosyltransferase [Candidatus Scalindua japonica]|uniref:Spore coat polysaccharide biosynthesis protein, predicted glycosyltransferase n=1 Tax=Candidatus Scalindua japonica TaxID=1284222 RepID=A0A286U460_9BACT|nr:glycosyltransferase [Candidatus Scalindua japonica]GAX62915.1 spore coat polysaccharide biosynthesis protein, predicted glycosyltransferase [Candidatus Scalindua japonica]